MVISNRKLEAPGNLSVYRSDFDKHQKGTGFRHTADNIDMNPPLSMPIPIPTNVQSTVEKIYSIMLSGNDFVSIGDGNQSFGTFTIGVNGNTTVEDCFADAIASPRFAKYGGTILLKNGLYNFTSTVVLPAGISVVGENCTMINATVPVFLIKESKNFEIKTTVPKITTDGYLSNKLVNLTFLDNFNESTSLLCDGSEFIVNEVGSNLEIIRCGFYGKIESLSKLTSNVVRCSSNPSSYNTILSITDCVIYGVQQIVEFITLSATDRLTFSRNRAWVTGVIGSPTTLGQKAAISSYGANIEICNNDFVFGIGLNQNIQTILYCENATSFKANIIITDNKIKLTDTSKLLENNLVRFSNTSNPVAGINYTGIVKNNITGGLGDNNWYIVVGDGMSTIGDFNGTNALQTIYDCYFRQTDFVNSMTGGQITIFIKPGSYTIGQDYFSTQNNAFLYSMVGLCDTSNIPQITLNYNSAATGGQNIYLGNHIENIHFIGNTNYYKIVLSDPYLENNAIGRSIYCTTSVCKKCVFENCSLVSEGYLNTTLDDVFVFNVDNCKFITSEGLYNLVANSKDIILIARNCQCPSNIVINKCSTSMQNYGSFLMITSELTTPKIKISLDGCNIYSIKNTNQIIKIGAVAEYVKINNCNINLSNLSVDSSVIANNSIISTTANTEINLLSSFIFTNNNIIGTDTNGLNRILYGVYVSGFNDIHINDNTFKHLPFAGYVNVLDGNGTTQTSHNVYIKDNKCLSGHNSYGFFKVLNSNYPITSSSNICICNNFIDMQNKLSTIYRSITPLPCDIRAVILVQDNMANINISDNTISKIKLNYNDTYAEAIIACITGEVATIENNIITYAENQKTDRWFYDIYVSNTIPTEANNTTNKQMATISGNKITNKITSSDIDKEVFVYIKDTKYFGVFENMMYANTSSYTPSLLTYVKINAGKIGFDYYSDGTISDNTFASTDDDYIAVTGDDPIKYSDGVSRNYRIAAYRNKGQLVKQIIDCTNFKQYGYNTTSTNGSPSPIDNYPSNKSTILLANRTMLDNSSVLNYNRYKQSILACGDYTSGGNQGSIISTWENLPNGLYYTNTVPHGYDPAESLSLASTKHQIIIPINIPDNVKLIGMEIPIYWRNLDSIAKVASASGSVIYGNYGSSYEYVIDDEDTNWAASNKTILADNSGTTNLALTNYNWQNDYVLNQNRLNAGVEQKCYALIHLSTNRTAVQSHTMYFAIPYLSVTYAYC